MSDGCIIVVFLDMDGVLLPFPASSHIQSGRIFPDETLDALTLLLEAFEQQVAIVLSSTWRVSENMRRDILNDFHAYGKGPLASMTSFYDITDPGLHTERQYEIHGWLEAHRDNPTISAWVALDDEELVEGSANAKYREEFVGHVVQCESCVGLVRERSESAIQLVRDQLSKFRLNEGSR